MPKLATSINDTQVKNAKPKLKDGKLIVNKLSDGKGLVLLANLDGS